MKSVFEITFCDILSENISEKAEIIGSYETCYYQRRTSKLFLVT